MEPLHDVAGILFQGGIHSGCQKTVTDPVLLTRILSCKSAENLWTTIITVK